MRILLAHNSLYYPSFGGGDKSNRLLMAALAARGHHTRVLARVVEFGPEAHEALGADLTARGVAWRAGHDDLHFHLDGADVRVFTRGRSLRAWITARMHEFHPEAILTSTDDPAHLMLEAALRLERVRVVYLIRALIALPFGPAATVPSETKTEVLRQVDGAVGVSEYVAAYAREWGGMRAVHHPISLPDRSEYPELGRFENRFVTMVNPCAGKGLAIFLALADHFREVEFAAVPTWGTTPGDLAELARRPNVTVLAARDDIDEIFRETRLALVPSLWAEARSRIIQEALARGIPVLASAVGGSAEAMLGLDYLLPVNPIVDYRARVDELMVPVVDVPPQPVELWIAALRRLLTDRPHYDELSRAARARAVAAAREQTVLPFEGYLRELIHAPRQSRPGLEHGSRRTAAHPTDALSPDKRRLLASRLKRIRNPAVE